MGLPACFCDTWKFAAVCHLSALGRVVARPVVGEMESGGEHEASFDTNSLPPGLYSCRIQSAGGVEMVAKMVVMR